MPHLSNMTIDRLTLTLIDNMIHLIEIIPIGLDSRLPYPELFSFDLNQFRAINLQLEMLLSTRPVHPWAQNDWYSNFTGLLSQTIRQSKHCLDKFASISNYASPVCLENLTGFLREVSPYLSYASTLVKILPSDPEGILISKSN